MMLLLLHLRLRVLTHEEGLAYLNGEKLPNHRLLALQVKPPRA